MVVCQYFLRGQCRFGDQCRNDHPNNSGQPGFGNQSWNANTLGSNPAPPAILFSSESISKDLNPQADRPTWILSSYGPAKWQQTLISGLDVSPEELRVKAMQAVKANAFQEYAKYESEQLAAADQILNNARNNMQQTHEQAIKNRDGTSSSSAFGSTSFGGTGSSAFGSGAATSSFGAPANSSVFGKASGFGAFAGNTPSIFGNSTFGQSSFGKTPQPSTSVFGQPAPSTSAFGSNSQTPSAFGQSGQATPVFGQPASATSAFGAPTQQPSAFAQPGTTSQPTSVFGSTGFGQSSFGQPAQPSSSVVKPATGAFGSTNAGGFSSFASGGGTGGAFSAFSGKPSSFGAGATTNAPTTTSAFGQSSFGNPATTTQPTSVFGAPGFGTSSAFSTQPQSVSTTAFGTLAPSATSVFGAQPAASGGSVFGAAPSAPQSVFGATPSQPQSVFSTGITSFSNPIQQPLAPSSALNTSQKVKPKTGKPDFANAKSTYKPGLNDYDAMLPPNYLQLIPKSAKEAFESKTFEWGKIPEWIPPLELR